jgi:hypothetical protein
MKVVEDNKDLTIINHDTLIKIAKAQAKSKKKFNEGIRRPKKLVVRLTCDFSNVVAQHQWETP